MDRLTELENRSIYMIREAYFQNPRLALLWSMGKDSTVLLWLCRKAFLGKLPFPVLHIDTSYKFERIYEFRDYFAREWDLDLVICSNEDALARGVSSEEGKKLDCCNALKTVALQQAIGQHGYSALLVGIRRDEHGVRAKERHFSPRDSDFRWNYLNQPVEPWDAFGEEVARDEHLRVHPLLDWSELDVWEYIRQEQLPVIDLYFSRHGKRYRSIGCEPCCAPINSTAQTVEEIICELRSSCTAEREGRAQDKEDPNTMQNLRALGYM